MAKMYITLQGKGGVGKSYVTATFAQWMLARGQKITCIDTDSFNPTFAYYKKLNVRHIKLSVDHAIDQRALDELMETLRVASDDESVIVDVGSNGFDTLMSYVVENGVFEFLQQRGHRIVCNSIIAGGPDAEDTLKGMLAIMRSTTIPIVLWLNEHMGPLVYQDRKIIELECWENTEDRIIGNVTMIRRTEQTFGQDIKTMLTQRLTYEEAIKSFNMMPASRVFRVREDLYGQLDQIGLIGQ